MGRTTNILDLNNRLEKVEKENVAQNSYTSLKNKPKINGHILTGDKSSSDLGLAAAGDITDINTAIGNMSDLDTSATDMVGAINEVNSFAKSILSPTVTLDSNDDLNTLLGAGVYRSEGTSAPAHSIGNNHIIWVIKHGAENYTRYIQLMYSFNSGNLYIRKTSDAGSNWTDWEIINTTTIQ